MEFIKWCPKGAKRFGNSSNCVHKSKMMSFSLSSSSLSLGKGRTEFEFGALTQRASGLVGLYVCGWFLYAARIRPGWRLFLFAAGVLRQRASGLAGVCFCLQLASLRSVNQTWLTFVSDCGWRRYAVRIRRGWPLFMFAADFLTQRASHAWLGFVFVCGWHPSARSYKPK